RPGPKVRSCRRSIATASSAVSGRMVSERSVIAWPRSALSIWQAEGPSSEAGGGPRPTAQEGKCARERLDKRSRTAKELAMGLLVDGVWQDEQHSQRTQSGRFVRSTTRFRNFVTEDGAPGPTGSGGFAAARGRYHLYVALACPWAHRTVIMRMLKGLEDVVSMSVVEPLYGPRGWRVCPWPRALAGTPHGTRQLSQIYLLADPRYTGRVSVPALWDKERRT